MDKQKLIDQLRARLHEYKRVRYSKSELNEIISSINDMMIISGAKSHLDGVECTTLKRVS